MKVVLEQLMGMCQQMIETMSKVLAMQDTPQPDPLAEPPADVPVTESGDYQAMFVPLLEKAVVRADGSIPLKIIQPGWGSSGYYPAAVLERDGPAVFKAGMQMFWNHQTAEEEIERPEGDLNDLAAVLLSDARWNGQGPAGPGLYADAKVFEAYQPAVNDLAANIGVSIRASGQAVQGEAEGQKGPIIQRIVAGKSIDFVTKPGAGGQIVQMFEAARHKLADMARPSSDVQTNKGAGMEIEKQLKETQEQLAQLQAQNARLQEAMLLQAGRQFVVEQLASCGLPDVTKGRLLESLAVNPAVRDGQLDRDAYAARISEAVKAEQAYLAQVAGYGRVQGMGASALSAPSAGSGGADEAAVQKRLAEGFKALGLNEKEAQAATSGRRW